MGGAVEMNNNHNNRSTDKYVMRPINNNIIRNSIFNLLYITKSRCLRVVG